VKVKRIIALTLLCLTAQLLTTFTNNLHAQMYYLKDLINHGLENSIEMVRSHNTLSNATDRKTISYLEILPTASYALSYTNPYKSLDYFSSGLSIGKSISLAEPTYFNIRRSIMEKKIADLNNENQRKKIAFDILAEYIQITRQRKGIQTMLENSKLQARIYNQVKIQYDSGRKTDYDLRQSEIDTLNTYIQLIELQEELTTKRENLFFRINMQDLGYPIEDYEFTINETYTPPETVDNFNLQIADLNLQQSKTSLNQEYIGLFPTLSAGYNWSASYSNEVLNQEFAKYENYSHSGTLFASFTYPLFDFLSSGLGYRISKRGFNLAKYEFDEQKEELEQQVTQLLNELRRMRTTYELYQQRHELARVTLQMAEVRFVQGSVSNLDLDKARLQFFESEYQLINQYYSLILKQEEYNFITSNKILGIW